MDGDINLIKHDKDATITSSRWLTVSSRGWKSPSTGWLTSTVVVNPNISLKTAKLSKHTEREDWWDRRRRKRERRDRRWKCQRWRNLSDHFPNTPRSRPTMDEAMLLRYCSLPSMLGSSGSHQDLGAGELGTCPPAPTQGVGLIDCQSLLAAILCVFLVGIQWKFKKAWHSEMDWSRRCYWCVDSDYFVCGQ